MDEHLILKLFDGEMPSLRDLLETVVKPEDIAATPYQINNFILNRREFCTDWAQMKQAKTEIFHRLCELNGMAYDYSKKELEIRKLNRQIDLLDETDPELHEIAIAEKELEIRQAEFGLSMIKIQAHARLQEAQEFFRTYQSYQELEDLSKEEIAALESEQWRIKSRYYPELGERYHQTPQGLVAFPHEEERKMLRG